MICGASVYFDKISSSAPSRIQELERGILDLHKKLYAESPEEFPKQGEPLCGNKINYSRQSRIPSSKIAFCAATSLYVAAAVATVICMSAACVTFGPWVAAPILFFGIVILNSILEASKKVRQPIFVSNPSIVPFRESSPRPSSDLDSETYATTSATSLPLTALSHRNRTQTEQ